VAHMHIGLGREWRSQENGRGRDAKQFHEISLNSPEA